MEEKPTSLSEALVLGATAGSVAANVMTVLRMFAHRRGWIDKTVPQAMEEWALDRTGLDLPGGPVSHHILDQLLHMGYATGLGAFDAYLYRRNFRNTYARGLAIGASTWAFASFFLLPALGASRPGWRSNRKENLVNLSAHLIFGLATALLTEEFVAQKARGPAGPLERELARVG